MGGNTPGGRFLGGNFLRGNSPGGVWLVEIFRVGVFLTPKKIYVNNFQVRMHWNWSSSEKSSFSKLIASVFSPPPIIFFSYGAEIFPYPLIQLTVQISALIGYSSFNTTDCSDKCPYWVHRDVNFSSHM